MMTHYEILFQTILYKINKLNLYNTLDLWVQNIQAKLKRFNNLKFEIKMERWKAFKMQDTVTKWLTSEFCWMQHCARVDPIMTNNNVRWCHSTYVSLCILYSGTLLPPIGFRSQPLHTYKLQIYNKIDLFILTQF